MKVIVKIKNDKEYEDMNPETYIKTKTYNCKEVCIYSHDGTAMLKMYSGIVFHVHIADISKIEE